jgi:hypothetical protein
MVERTILSAILVRPFRCAECGARFFRWSLRKNVSVAPSETLNPQADTAEHQDLLGAERLNLKLSS